MSCAEPLDDSFIGDQLVNAAIAFIILETCFVGLRFFARHVAGTRLSWDDVLIPMALVFNYGLCVVGIVMVRKGGVGHHYLWNVCANPEAMIVYLKLQLPFTVTQAFAIAFAKVGILFMFLRIFVQPAYRYATYTLIAMQAGSLIATTVVQCLVCTPYSYLWEPQLHPEGHCIDMNSFWRWTNFPQIVTDVAILVLPLPALMQLQLSKKDKIGVVATFCTGAIGLVTSIIRFVIFYSIDGQADGSWVATRLGSISIAETGMYVFAACLPIYRSLYRSIKSRGDTSASSKTGYGSGRRSHAAVKLEILQRSQKGFELSDEYLVSQTGRIRVKRDVEITSAPHH